MSEEQKQPLGVMCVGEALIDRISGEPGRALADVERWHDYPGGAPANVATGLAKLGTPAQFVGALGQDAAGRQLQEQCRQAGVGTGAVQWCAQAPTRTVYVERDTAGERHFAGFGGRDTTDFADCYLSEAQLPANVLEGVGLVVTGTLGLAYPVTREALVVLSAKAWTRGVDLVMDVNWRPVFWPEPELATGRIRALLPQVAYLKLSREEAGWLFATEDPGVIAARHAHLKGVLVTKGAEGCAYAVGPHRGEVAAYPVEAQDTTGAGDGFLAGWLHRLAARGGVMPESRAELERMIAYGAAVGAMVATRAGAMEAQPDAQAVAAFMQAREEVA